jgi:glucose/arabinose dehydrogenase
MKPHFLLALLACASPALAQDLTTELIVSGLENPTDLQSPPGDDRLFVALGAKGIYIIEDGVLLGVPFLNMNAEVGQSRGFVSMCFHPDYANNGKFYVVYSSAGASQLVEYEVSTTNPYAADRNTAKTIAGPEPLPSGTHNWDCVQFGPDGMLYLSTGDGSAIGDFVNNRAQDPMSLFGKILRFDPSLPAPYIPADNPYVGDFTTRDEIWARGLRNPWRFAFDGVTGDMWLGDVGLSSWEEINFVPAGAGASANFGWRCLEGSSCTNFGTCSPLCGDANWIAPAYEFPHTDLRCASIGGYVYRGQEIPVLQGKYLFSDYCTSRVFSTRHDGQGLSDFTELTDQLVPNDGVSSLDFVGSFGVDGHGELYLIENGAGEIFKIIKQSGFFAYCDANPNSTGVGATISGSGSVSVADNFTLLRANNLPTNRLGYFLMSDTAGFIPLFGGSQGNLCLGVPLIRFVANAMNSGPAGQLTLLPDFASLPGGAQFLPGESWNFQAWYRDAGSTSNTTHGLRVTFEL